MDGKDGTWGICHACGQSKLKIKVGSSKIRGLGSYRFESPQDMVECGWDCIYLAYARRKVD